jgi:hypothetical protein
MADSFAGFSTIELSQYFGLSQPQTGALLSVINKKTLTKDQYASFQSINPVRLQPGATSYNQGFGDIPYGLTHLNEHPKGSHFAGSFNLSFSDFNLVKAFDRLFTIRPKSFTAGNLISGFAQSAIGTVTGGTLNVTDLTAGGVPISGGGQHDANLVTSFATGASSFGQVRAGNPASKETALNKLSRLLGGVYDSIAIGGIGSSWLSTPTVAPETAGYVKELTALEKLGNYAGTGLSSATSTFGQGQFAQGVLSVLGNKIGGTLLALISGNFTQAFQLLTQDAPQPFVTLPPQAYGGGGGGGGSGYPSGNVGQSQDNTVLYALGGVALLIGVLYWIRKR